MNQGIYIISHVESGKRYIGSSVSLKRRLNRHRNELRKGIHRCKHLQRAWTKYGEEAFALEVVEHVQDDSELLIREQYWIDTQRKMNELYNTCPKAGSPLGMKLTPEQRAKISEAHKGKKKSEEHCAALKNAAQNRIHTAREIDMWRFNRVGKVSGSANPAAKRCEVEGVEYGCVKDAMHATGWHRAKVERHPTFKRL